ncbi:cryptochrome/photolyase family protein [Actinocatenispora rupis]|uniref:Deoxyribodipyrimidine photo-lyase n=1 Tax=Actinocatenispora rupis TaxID=519421 RepID=A0A8J3J603_9ACTN|nr:deoxyribodipyrimidine photo-lyase [Actinocatenispora rupis]GID12730.1 deoxyribodipyrimidine photo-lyase [Actinocatenispora rupis]
MDTAIVLFTRDLRIHDNPALDLACRSARHVVPLFVVHDGLGFAVPNRLRYLHDSLADLRRSLRARGGDLVVRHGEPVAETLTLAREVRADGIVLARDVSRYAHRRLARLERACRDERIALRAVDSATVVPPGAVTPAAGDHFRVFTPYWRAWERHPRRDAAATPERVTLPAGVRAGALPAAPESTAELPAGGETAARRRMVAWLRGGLAEYADRHDDLAADGTSRLSADLHFGCLSPLELATRAARAGGAGGEAYVRQLCWRDFHAQVADAFEDLPRRDYRPRPRDWRDDPDALAAWREGQTGLPIVDAGMRQLAAEGFLHNRARLLVASFLAKDLGVHWTAGAAHFFDLLTDGDIANNAGNWQWVAGTGNDTRPNRRFNPVRQAYRFDPDGSYVRRYVPELAGVPGRRVHEPWTLPRHPAGYPLPVVEPPVAR